VFGKESVARLRKAKQGCMSRTMKIRTVFDQVLFDECAQYGARRETVGEHEADCLRQPVALVGLPLSEQQHRAKQGTTRGMDRWMGKEMHVSARRGRHEEEAYPVAVLQKLRQR